MTVTAIDIGIVLLPNKECKDFADSMTQTTVKELPNLIKLPNNPHITLIHISNQNPQDVLALQKEFEQFYNKVTLKSFNLPIKGIKATGGSPETGYKWLDLQFYTPETLRDLRSQAVKTFCPLHKGVLTRMQDDESNLIEGSQAKKDIDKCGVTFSTYLPHITTWYVDLPNENKVIKLEEIAKIIHPNNINCVAKDIALVELGRNGNAIKIIEQLPLNTKTFYNSLTQGIIAFLIVITYLLFSYRKGKKNSL